jgi:hypothetical protein
MSLALSGDFDARTLRSRSFLKIKGNHAGGDRNEFFRPSSASKTYSVEVAVKMIISQVGFRVTIE